MTKVLRASIDMTEKQKDELMGSIFKILREMAEESDAGSVSYDMTLPDGWIYSILVKPPKKKKQS